MELLNGNCPSKTVRRTKKTRMTPAVMTFYWGIRGDVKNAGHHTIYLPADYRAAFDQLLKGSVIPDDMPFYVSVPSATDPGLAPRGDTLMFVLVLMPLLSETGGLDWEETVSDVKARVLERLRQHCVEIAPEAVAVEEVYTPADWSLRFGLYDGSAFGAAHTLFQMGPLRCPNYAEGIKGLYYVGASTTPGTGMPMVTLGGEMVSRRIVSDLKSQI
jgi:phytoene desaturase